MSSIELPLVINSPSYNLDNFVEAICSQKKIEENRIRKVARRSLFLVA